MADEAKNPELLKGLTERQKAHFDFHKHVTTLNTAAVLFFATVLEKFRPPANRGDKLCVELIMGAFLLSLLAALTSMLHWTLHIGSPKDPNKNLTWLALMAVGECLLFMVGLALVACYVAIPFLWNELMQLWANAAL